MQPREDSQLEQIPTPRAVGLEPGSVASRRARAERAASDSSRSSTLEAQFEAIYASHFRLVWRALGRLGVREPDLMDLTQKVFLTVYLKLPEFEGRSLVSTWLWGICRRVASGYRRSGSVRYEVATDPVSLERSAEQRRAITGNEGSTRQTQLESILSKLSEPQRVVFLLFEVDEMDGREIAALLNISVGTVRSRLRYARKMFRREVHRLALVSAFPAARKT